MFTYVRLSIKVDLIIIYGLHVKKNIQMAHCLFYYHYHFANR